MRSYIGKSLDKRLRELGAVPFHAPAFADEATNMEETIEPWIKSLYESLEALRDGEIRGGRTQAHAEPEESSAPSQALGLPDRVTLQQESTLGNPIEAVVPKGNGPLPSAAVNGNGVSTTVVEVSTSKASITDEVFDPPVQVKSEVGDAHGAATKASLSEHR